MLKIKNNTMKKIILLLITTLAFILFVSCSTNKKITNPSIDDIYFIPPYQPTSYIAANSYSDGLGQQSLQVEYYSDNSPQNNVFVTNTHYLYDDSYVVRINRYYSVISYRPTWYFTVFPHQPIYRQRVTGGRR